MNIEKFFGNEDRRDFVFPSSEAASRCMDSCDKFCRWGTTRQYGCVSKHLWIVKDSLLQENHPEETLQKICIKIVSYGGKSA